MPSNWITTTSSSDKAVVGEAYARGYQLVQVATVEGQPQPTLYFERIQTQSA